MSTEHDIANNLQVAIDNLKTAPPDQQSQAQQALDEALLAALSSIYVAVENTKAGILTADHAINHIADLTRLALMAVEARTDTSAD